MCTPACLSGPPGHQYLTSPGKIYMHAFQGLRHLTGYTGSLEWLVDYLSLKGARSYFSKFRFSVSFKESSLQRCKFEISVEMVKPFRYTKQICILQLPIISYCISLIMVTITRHVFINILQTECFSALWNLLLVMIKICDPLQQKVPYSLTTSYWFGINSFQS